MRIGSIFACKLVVFSVKWRERLALGKSLAIHSDERVATLEAAKVELEVSWRQWLAWAKLGEVE